MVVESAVTSVEKLAELRDAGKTFGIEELHLAGVLNRQKDASFPLLMEVTSELDDFPFADNRRGYRDLRCARFRRRESDVDWRSSRRPLGPTTAVRMDFSRVQTVSKTWAPVLGMGKTPDFSGVLWTLGDSNS
jgi:hypothetical protein